MGEVVLLSAYRARRSPVRRQEYLESRITALLARLEDAPDVAAEILRLRNEVWLLEAEPRAPSR